MPEVLQLQETGNLLVFEMVVGMRKFPLFGIIGIHHSSPL